jgi:hypothetical protein
VASSGPARTSAAIHPGPVQVELRSAHRRAEEGCTRSCPRNVGAGRKKVLAENSWAAIHRVSPDAREWSGLRLTTITRGPCARPLARQIMAYCVLMSTLAAVIDSRSDGGNAEILVGAVQNHAARSSATPRAMNTNAAAGAHSGASGRGPGS